jgi:HAD superfamily hydrolase (TIGR01509 family)
VGVRKPHRDIYLKALAAAHAAPQETLYIDDRADLIEEAKKLKLVTILFKDTDSLKKKLKELKIIL